MPTYHYTDSSPDFNGCYGPMTTDGTWITVEADSYEDAFRKLPQRAKGRIIEATDRWIKNGSFDGKIGEGTWLEDLIYASCGWGLTFSILSQADWDDQIEAEGSY